MAIRRHYPGSSFRPITTTFPERVQEDKWHFTHPQATPRGLRSTPHLYQYYAKPLGFSADSFAETVHAIDLPTLDPGVQRRSRYDTAQYEYFFDGFSPRVPNVNNFKPSNPDTTSSKKSTPSQYPYFFGSPFPIVPNVGEFQPNNSLPRFANGRLVNYMGQPAVEVFVTGRVRTLPLLGCG